MHKREIEPFGANRSFFELWGTRRAKSIVFFVQASEKHQQNVEILNPPKPQLPRALLSNQRNIYRC